MSGRGFFLALVIFTLLLIGLATLNGGVIALALPLVLYFTAAIYYRPTVPRLSAQRFLSTDRIFPDTPVTISLIIRNEGPSLEEIHIEDALPHGLELLQGNTELYTSLDSGQEVTLEYTVRGKRGDYRFSGFRATYREGAGLFEATSPVQASHRLIVRPRPARLKPMRIRPPQTRGFAGPIPARQGGAGVDFFTVREYQSGDQQRRINWKVAARSEADLYTNVYEQERVADVGIILDAREQSYGDLPDHPLFEKVVQATASICEGYLNDGNRVGLLVYGGGIESAFPGVGKTQRQRILQVLARARPGRNFALETLRYLPTRFFPPRSQIILVSPLLQADVDVLISLRALGYAVLVISPNLLLFDAAQENKAPDPLALRLALAERALLLQKVRRAGVQVIDWNTEVPIEQISRRYSVRSLAVNPTVEASR